MESTGVYWIPLLQILKARGLKIFLITWIHRARTVSEQPNSRVIPLGEGRATARPMWSHNIGRRRESWKSRFMPSASAERDNRVRRNFIPRLLRPIRPVNGHKLDLGISSEAKVDPDVAGA